MRAQSLRAPRPWTQLTRETREARSREPHLPGPLAGRFHFAVYDRARSRSSGRDSLFTSGRITLPKWLLPEPVSASLLRELVSANCRLVTRALRARSLQRDNRLSLIIRDVSASSPPLVVLLFFGSRRISIANFSSDLLTLRAGRGLFPFGASAIADFELLFPLAGARGIPETIAARLSLLPGFRDFWFFTAMLLVALALFYRGKLVIELLGVMSLAKFVLTRLKV